MGIATIGLVAFIGAVIIWMAVLKRGAGEAMIVAFFATSCFAGTRAPQLMLEGLYYSATQDVLFASVNFGFMAYLLRTTGLIERLINLLNSLVGRVRGGAAYTATLASGLFGVFAHSTSANTATIGAIMIPWMKRTGWPPEIASSIAAGNAGLGPCYPPSATMLTLLSFPVVAQAVKIGDLFAAMLVAATYTLIYRLLLVRWMVFRYQIKAMEDSALLPLRKTFKEARASFLIIVGMVISLAVTIGPLPRLLAANPDIGEKAMQTISVIVWVPVLVILATIIVGWRALPRTPAGIFSFVLGGAKNVSLIGVLVVFALAAGNILIKLGLTTELLNVLSHLHVAKYAVVVVVALMAVVVATPLNSIATMTTVGAVGFSIMVATGVHPIAACAMLIMCTSTEGASPPSGPPIYIAAGIAEVDPGKTFVPLIFYYMLPIMILAILVGMGLLPLPLPE